MKTITENIKAIIAIGTLLFCFTYLLICLISETYPQEGVIIAIVAVMYRPYEYYYGSSNGNAKKDETINNLTNK